MTRYSRSVIPGRPSEDGGGDQNDPSLDGLVFGSKKKVIAAPANDRERGYADPMDMDVDEAGFLVERSSKERRGANGDRRKAVERRKEDGRRRADYAPLREPGTAHRGGEGNSRGPILLVAAILIVAVFGVVVWNAYREGVRTDDPEAAPALSAGGAFKTPPREVKDTSPALGQSAEVEILEGGPSPVVEQRPQPQPAVVAPSAAAPAPSKFTSPPPAPLKQPEAMKPATAPTAKPTPAAPTVAATVPAKVVDLPKPVALAPATVVAAAATVPAAPATAAPAGAFKPAFAAGGAWVVQVAAPSTEAGAMSEWDKRVKALPEFFATAERFIVNADVNGKSVYRLRAGTFASKADADAFCTAYKGKGGNCFPAAK